MTTSPVLSYCQNRLCGVARFAWRLIMWVVVLLALVILLLRYALLPNISHYREQMSATVSASLGVPMVIGRIEADWNGVDPRMTLRDVQVFDAKQSAALVLPEIKVRLSWWSLPTLQLRLAHLQINGATLHIQRDAQGKIFIGGIALAQQSGDNNTMSDWLLHQSAIEIHDAQIIWQDNKRGAPPLVLKAVNLRIASDGDRHRFALNAVPDARLSTPLEVRGDFTGRSFAYLKTWHGQVFTQLNHADITAWRPWFNLPPEFSRGQGGLRGWLDIAQGKITHLTGDLAVQDVATKLSDEVPEMVLHRLNGRATWGEIPGGFEINTEQLTMSLSNGVALPTTDLLVRIVDAQNDTPAHGEMRANVLQLETLVSLANFIPLPKPWRAQLDGYAPRGKVHHLDVSWSSADHAVQHFKVKGEFEHFGIEQFGKVPGFDNLTAAVTGDDHAGSLRIQSQQLHVDAPDILREPVVLDALNMQLNWQQGEHDWEVDVPLLVASNADMAGSASIKYRTARNSPGILDLMVKLNRADVSKVARYTPLFAVNRGVSNWLHDALLAGKSDDFYLRIKGNLKDFPFEDNGIFELTASVQAGALKFSADWPTVEKITGNLLMRGKQLAFNTLTATMLDVPTHSISAQVTDLKAQQVALLINVDSTADNRDFLRLIQGSPVRGYVQGFTDSITADGIGHLDVSVNLPHVGEKQAEVKGSYFFADNEVDLGGAVPVLHHVKGELQFTQNGLHTRDLTADILGGAATLAIETKENGRVHAQVQGKSNIAALRTAYPHPAWSYWQGETAWDVAVEVQHKIPHVVVTSDLKGLRSTLPVPFGKNADEAMPLRIEKSTLATQETITMQLGNLLSARLLRPHDAPAKLRGTVQFGGQGAWIEQDGLWLTGYIPELSVQGWQDFASDSPTENNVPIAVQNLRIGALSGYGQALHEVQLNAQKRGAVYAMQLASKALTGELLWQPQGKGKLTANLQNLNWQGDAPALPAVPTAESSVQLAPEKLPALDVSIDHLQIKNKQIGKVSLAGHPEGDGWRLQQLLVTNPDGSLSGDGVWHGGKPRTEINALLTISDAGKVMARSGYPKTVQAGSGTLAAKLAWAGTPMTFNYATLDGSLKLDTDKGRFLKIEPGIAKLLGVLSLQALPRHITLDFTDVFSDGFQFDHINGNALIHNGVMNTQDLHIDGSSAKVTMQGSVNLNQETQQLRVEILPAVGESLSLLSGFAGGPIVGVGTLIFSKLLGNPFDKLVSFQYNINGTWSEPVIVKVGQTPVKVVMPPPPNPKSNGAM